MEIAPLSPGIQENYSNWLKGPVLKKNTVSTKIKKNDNWVCSPDIHIHVLRRKSNARYLEYATNVLLLGLVKWTSVRLIFWFTVHWYMSTCSIKMKVDAKKLNVTVH